jgi:hypothetical protein
MSSKVNWYGDRVSLQVEGAEREIIKRLAFQTEGQAKVNIQANGQIDTGYMLNSVYAVTPDGDDYAEAAGAASARNPEAEMAPRVEAPEGGAAVAVGAEYAAYQEMANAFLYPALETVAGQAEGVIVAVGRERLR